MYKQSLSSGKFRFFESYIDPETMTRKTISITVDKDTTASRKYASEALSARIQAIKAKKDRTAPLPLKSLTEAYITHQKAHVSPQTAIGDENALKAIRKMFGDDTDIRRIDARAVTEILDASGETPTRKNYRLKTVKKLFRWAYQYDYIDSDWTGKLKKYKDSEKARREFKYMEPDELRDVLDAMNVEKYRILTEFLALTGLRIGEALALARGDIDGDTIHVRRALSLVTYKIGDPKTEDSRRDVHIQTELAPLVKRIPPQCFTDIAYPAYNKYLKETTEKVIGRSLSPHALRHTHVSLLAAAGVPLDVISHRCGHSDSDVTREIYLHVTQQMKDRDAEILDGVRILNKTKTYARPTRIEKSPGIA